MADTARTADIERSKTPDTMQSVAANVSMPTMAV